MKTQKFHVFNLKSKNCYQANDVDKFASIYIYINLTVLVL